MLGCHARKICIMIVLMLRRYQYFMASSGRVLKMVGPLYAAKIDIAPEDWERICAKGSSSRAWLEACCWTDGSQHHAPTLLLHMLRCKGPALLQVPSG